MSDSLMLRKTDENKMLDRSTESDRNDQGSAAVYAYIAIGLGSFGIAVAFVAALRFGRNISDALIAGSAIGTMLATGIVAHFTHTLSRATGEMRQTANSQLSMMAGQLASMETQGKQIEREFAAEHRPWIAVEVEPYQYLTFPPEKDGFINLQFSFRNMGRVPAMNLWVGYVLVPPNVDPVEAQRNVIESLEQESVQPRPPGISVVPGGAPATLNLPYHIPANEVAAWREWRRQNRTKIHDSRTHIAGCVVYRSPLDSGLHHTGFIRELHRAEYSQPGYRSGLFPIDPDMASLSPADQTTRGSVLGGSTID